MPRSNHALPSLEKMILPGQYFTVKLFGGERIRNENTDVRWHRNPDFEQQWIRAVQKSVQTAGMYQMQQTVSSTWRRHQQFVALLLLTT